MQPLLDRRRDRAQARPPSSLAALVALSLVAALLASAPSRALADPASNAGELSTVTLIDVSRLPGELIDMVQPGAEDGLVFLFLVVKRPGAEGVPTMRELRDFDVERQSYRKQTSDRLGAAIEPVTFLEDANEFLERVTPGAGHESIVADGDAYVVVATIGGVKLPASGRGAVRIEVGWGGQTEPLSFSFAVPPAIEPGAREIPAVPGVPSPVRAKKRGILT